MTITRASIPMQISRPPMKKKMAQGKPKGSTTGGKAKKMLKEIKGGR